MKTLYLDIGNSRVKWYCGTAPLSARAHDGEVRACLDRVVAEAQPGRVVAVDVTGAAGALDGIPVSFLESGPVACGITNGYRDPQRLGPDRWAAMIGARALVSGALCVADAGTALTVDLLDAEGRHLGGWIAPGHDMSVTALLGGTHGIRFEPGAKETREQPGRDTGVAVLAGVRCAAIGMVERARRDAADRLGIAPALLVTGGNGMVLADALDDCLWVEDLVLQGLVHWDRERSR